MKECHIPENLYLQQRHYANLKRKVHSPTLLLQILHCHVAHFRMSVRPPYLLHTLLLLQYVTAKYT